MRDLRLALVGTVTLALLCGLSGAGVAQDENESAATATYFTGTQTWTDMVGEEPTMEEVRGVQRFEGGGYTFEVEASDPRVSGVLTISDGLYDKYGSEVPANNLEGTTFADVRGGYSVTLANDEGGWSGITGHSVYAQGMGWRTSMWLKGEGAYQGLTLFVHSQRDLYSDPFTPLEGLIFEGLAPRLVEPPTE